MNINSLIQGFYRFSLATCLVVAPGWAGALRAAPVGAIVADSNSPQAMLAAREVQRYVYLRTGAVLPLRSTPSGREVNIEFRRDPALGADTFRLRTADGSGGRILRITGGSDLALLYGAYRFAETLGVQFEVQGDVVPDGRIPLALPNLDEVHAPLFATRGIQPFHDFTEGPDWWSADDYKAYFAQMAKMRFNFAGFHCYPEGGVGPEPLVWIGLPEDVNADGTVKFSYPSRWASTTGGSWGYAPMRSSDFAAGAGLLFPSDDFGSPVTDGFRPLPPSPEQAGQLFNRAGSFLGDVFGFAHRLGVRTCIGTETPLQIPQAVRRHLEAKGLSVTNGATVQQLYQGMFKRIAKTQRLDYYWLWTPEDWTWGGNKPAQYAATIADIRAAQAALDELGRPFTLATCGWVLGPQNDRAALDRDLPRTSPMSCINRDVGFDFVETAFARVDDRPKWVIPWLEDDPDLTGVQLFCGRTRRDAADAHAYGCTGLLGIHWRTRILSPNFGALAQAAWDQRAWNPEFGQRFKPEPGRSDVRDGGAVVSYSDNEIAGTTTPAVYRDCTYDVNAYRVKVPNGTYAVTLQFCEVHYTAAGKRVFGVNLQGAPVLEHLDVFGRVGKNRALDFTFRNVAVTNQELLIEFVREVELPFIGGIVIDGTAVSGQPFTRKINCGGEATAGYEADLPPADDTGGRNKRPRDLPCADFYTAWARAQFGPTVANAAAALFSSLDGGAGDYRKNKATRMPRPTDWLGGPGGIKPNPRSWSDVSAQYDFVEKMEALRSQVNGAAELARFDYWLNSFRYQRVLGQLGCTRGQLDRVVKQLGRETDAGHRQELAIAEALPLRVTLARQWETMMTLMLQTVSTPGELGTIANLEQHTLRNSNEPHFMDLHDAKLAEWSGRPLPAEAQPRRDYQGPPRVIVPTVRSVAQEGEVMELTVLLLDMQLPAEASLFYRPLGQGKFRTLPLRHIARGVYRVRLPAVSAKGLEYYVRVGTAKGENLFWPASAPKLSQTVVALPTS